MKKIGFIFLALIVSRFTFGQKDNLKAFIDSIAKENRYNGSIIVECQKRRMYSRGFGMANFQYNIPNETDTKFKICSITKLFTSVLIMKLYDEGKIELNKTIGTYLPEYKGEGLNKITIFHLLTATSGLEISEGEENNMGEVTMYNNYYSADEILEKFCSGKLINEPGKKWNYNNADYIILGKIIEAVSKKSYEEALNERILIPLSMTNSGMCTNSRVINNLASVYQLTENGRTIENDPHYYVENYYAAGAMYSNAEDLLKFSNALYGGKLLRQTSLEKLLTPYLNSYGFGLWINERQVNNLKVKIIERQGSIWGATTRLLYLSDLDITIILLTNLDQANLDEFQIEIIKHLVH